MWSGLSQKAPLYVYIVTSQEPFFRVNLSVDQISNHYYLFLTETFNAIDVTLLSGRPKTWNKNIWTAYKNYFRSDHYRFWNADPSLPAVLVTDSSNYRGYMQQCYHENCDDISHVTSEMMTFLGQTADSLVEVATNMTNEKCQMKKTGKVMWSFSLSRRLYL